MPTARLLYFSAAHVRLYRWSNQQLREEARFEHDEAGLEAFAAQVKAGPQSVYHLIADVVEEDFTVDTIPFLRGKDRSSLLARRLTQRYRDASLSTTASLGYERTQRREERVLLSAFTNVEALEPWLAILVQENVAVSGLYSPGLLAPAMARALGRAKGSVLLVTVHEAGLRQSYIENGKLRFSRLSPLIAEDLSDRQRMAIALGTETGRVYQYLRATNTLPVDHPPLSIVVIAPPGEAETARRYMPELPQLHIEVLDQREVGLKLGYVPPASAESFFLYLLAKQRPGTQYAPTALRRQYSGLQTRLAIIAGGAFVAVACLIATAATLWQVQSLRADIEEAKADIATATAQYEQIEAGFPPLPTTREKLRATMAQYESLSKLPSGPERFAVELSTALDASPRVELQKFRWHVAAAPHAAAGPGGRYELLEIEASLNGVPSSDYRAANMVVEAFIAELKKYPQLEIMQAKMPFETGSQESLSAQIGQGAAMSDTLRFTLILGRKVGA